MTVRSHSIHLPTYIMVGDGNDICTYSEFSISKFLLGAKVLVDTFAIESQANVLDISIIDTEVADQIDQSVLCVCMEA